jgi:hypothetical protein
LFERLNKNRCVFCLQKTVLKNNIRKQYYILIFTYIFVVFYSNNLNNLINKTMKKHVLIYLITILASTAFFSCNKNENIFVPTAPIISTYEITGITGTSALSGGNVSDDGGSSVSELGVVWSTSPTPTIALSSKTNDRGNSSNEGPFISAISGLTGNTTYYVRAYATNETGTSYGNELSFTTTREIGDSFQGGIIAYILQPADQGYDPNVLHGIIAAPVDQSTSASWSITLTTTGATGQAIGTGQANTNSIVNDQGAGSYAAKLCDDLVIGDYSDWYLPSMYELEKLYLNKDIIGGFVVAFYWSSSETDTNNAWLQSFNSNSQTSGTKTNSYYVRAIRSF